MRVFPSGARLVADPQRHPVLTQRYIERFGEIHIPDGAEDADAAHHQDRRTTREPEEIPEKESISPARWKSETRRIPIHRP